MAIVRYWHALLCTTRTGLGQSFWRTEFDLLDHGNFIKTTISRSQGSHPSNISPGELSLIHSLIPIIPLSSHHSTDILLNPIEPSTHSKPRLPRRRLRPALQVRVRIANRPSNSVESEARGFGRELHFGADVEEGEIAVHEVVRDAGCFVLEGIVSAEVGNATRNGWERLT